MSPYYQSLRNAVGHDLLIMPSVAAVIHDEDGRLLLQLKHNGSWSLPAGAIEPGESPEQAVLREILEETGIHGTNLRVRGVLGGSPYRYTYSNGDQVEYVIVLFECEVGSSEAVIDTGETKELRYFSRHEMPELAVPYDLDLLFAKA
ncbi:NUDIX domain-containing protein [Phragmitibacter flavus]|uniref:NUDIX domain-containing protein n=1 Tax=Phragmitibacter flavus TaxID=2576071 RepID=A0A5R8KK67_9BACT|nr:NUDIX domain-containing protein [Phragmitibacter flavus]TLD72647.1 NUDIX domain-containing protein [Phragmitibacter flavus]